MSLNLSPSDMMSLFTWEDLPTYQEAIQSAKNFLKTEKAAETCNVLCLRDNGEINLLRVDPQGEIKEICNLGSPI